MASAHSSGSAAMCRSRSAASATQQLERWGREWSARYGMTDDMVTRSHAELAALVRGGPRPPLTLATAPPPSTPTPLLLG